MLYVPEIDQNQLGVGQLLEKDYEVVFEDKGCLIKDAVSPDIFKEKMKAKSFALNPLDEEQIAFSIKKNVTELWYKKVGHFHHHGLLQMKCKKMANDLPEFDDHKPNCSACQFRKQNRKDVSQGDMESNKEGAIDLF